MKKRKRVGLFCLFSILILVLSLRTIAAEPYYHPYAHNANVPEHPELKPVGNLKTETFTGVETYKYEIGVPKGTNNLTPLVVLSYNSHLTYSKPTFLGTGWVLSSYDYIQRNTNYSFASTGDDYFAINSFSNFSTM